MNTVGRPSGHSAFEVKLENFLWLVSQGESRRHAAARVGWNDYRANMVKILQRHRVDLDTVEP